MTDSQARMLIIVAALVVLAFVAGMLVMQRPVDVHVRQVPAVPGTVQRVPS